MNVPPVEIPSWMQLIVFVMVLVMLGPAAYQAGEYMGGGEPRKGEENETNLP